MFKEILYEKQLTNIRLLEIFSEKFYLAGGTAIALQLGHRKSIDFDLFSKDQINNTQIINNLKKEGFVIDRIMIDNKGEELTIIIGGIKVTFLYYPFDIELTEEFSGVKIPNLKILGAMKFYTIGRRSKWKDYVDIYFLFKNGYSLSDISKIAEKIFEGGYNEKLLREQLCYYKDIDYSEEIDYLGEKIENKVIEKNLIETAKK